MFVCRQYIGTINICMHGDLPQVFDESTKMLQEKLHDGGLPNPIVLLSTRIPSQAIVGANREVWCNCTCPALEFI